MNWKRAFLTIKDGNKIARILIAFTKAARLNTLEGTESEYDSEEPLEVIICYSDFSSEEEDLTYNSWAEEFPETEDDQSIGNPAIFLAEKEQANDQNAEWDLEKDLHVGPLDYHQQQLFLQLINNSADVCTSSQMDIERTNILKHNINTGNNTLIAK